ncbi:hypothetical protein [Streptomyces sp. NPDC058964]|uniref:hypothetical protein n=1 Tax=Streptomyces sp. NPDC058964 TaxID=3346681 RepID=UPI0036A63396
MSEFAGVDPQRVWQLAQALKKLAETLARETPTIKSNFSEWGGTLDQSALVRQVAQVADDAHGMALRADLAKNLLDQRHGGPVLSSPGHESWVTVPWDTKDIDTAKEARQEAADLHNAISNPKDPTSRKIMADVVQSLADHKDDAAYMSAFTVAGGLGDAAGVAGALHTEDSAHDGTVVLSADSEKLLEEYGAAAQQMSRLAVSGKLPGDSSRYLTQLTSPPNSELWSASMLFKYGPPGSKWDSTVMADMSRTVLDHLHDPGMAVPKLSMNDDEQHDRTVQKLEAEFSASSAVLSAAAQNGAAARDILGGADGARYAKIIEAQDQWQIAGAHGGHGTAYTEARFGGQAPWSIPAIDNSGAAAKLMITATTAPRGVGPDSQKAAQAFANLADSLPSATGDKAFVEPAPIHAALNNIVNRYRHDFAYSSLTPHNSDLSLATQHGGDSKMPWQVWLTGSALTNVLGQAFYNDQKACSAFKAGVSMDLGTTTAFATKTGDLKPMQQTSALIGWVQRTENTLKFSDAQQKDIQAAADAQADAVLQGGAWAALGFIPIPEAGAAKAIVSAAVNTTALLDATSQPIVASKFNTGHAAQAIQDGNDAFFKDKKSVWYPMAMSLVHNGVIKAPPEGTPIDPDWVETQLDTQSDHNPQLKALQNRYGPGQIFTSLTNQAVQQISTGE